MDESESIDYKAVCEQLQNENEEIKRRMTLLLMRKSWYKEFVILFEDFCSWCLSNINKIILVLNGIFALLGIVYMIKATLFSN